MPLTHRDYTVGCICPMGVELAPVKAMLDDEHPSLPTQRDQNSFVLGEMCGHNVAIAVLPEIGTNAAATAAIQLVNDFPSIRFGLLVGIGGGVPDEEDDELDIRLGDVVISKPTASLDGVVQYDLGKYSTGGGFERTGGLSKPPALLRASVERLVADHRMKGSRVPQYLDEMLQQFPAMEEEYSHPGPQHDQLFRADYPHPGGATCRQCDGQRTVEREARRNTNPKFHYGTIGSANTRVKDAKLREELRQSFKVLCVEMEAAGLMDSFPCLVIRGICDYADSHKNKKWQPYAAATAAGYMKELLSVIPPKEVTEVSPAAEVVQMPTYERGINLFDAPDLADELFVGRDSEMQEMEKILRPGSDVAGRRVLVLGGMGGIGKTQLSITYAKRHAQDYSSIFWLDATSESALKAGFRLLAHRILPGLTIDELDDDRLRIEVSNWLCELDNRGWLLIFDNYDHPDEFKIAQYYPAVTHGSIMVTTQLPSRVNGRTVMVRSLDTEEDSLRILSARSGRGNIDSGTLVSSLDPASHELTDIDARKLARRLDGHPLALATAGAYLQESAFSFSRYLQQYETHWTAVASEGLADYPTHTLYTTWSLSFLRIQQESDLAAAAGDLEAAASALAAAELLRYVAYLDPRNIWYGLFRGYQGQRAPWWFTYLAESEAGFESAIRTLIKYCLVEAQCRTGSYGVHTCVHDWTLHGLNQEISAEKYWLAFDSVAGYLRDQDWDDLAAVRHGRMTAHAGRLACDRFGGIFEEQELVQSKLDEAAKIAMLLGQQVRLTVAEEMYSRALRGYENALGPDHTSTLNTVNNLGNLYSDQGKLDRAEEMYSRALRGYENALGPDHTSTLSTVNNLGLLYRDQGKLDRAEEMYSRALRGYENALGPDHTSTLNTVHNLGVLYSAQGKLDRAEEMCSRALRGREKALGTDHMSTLNTVNNLGNLYSDQGKLDRAEEMYSRALRGYENALGPDHTSTLSTVNNLGNLYRDQGKLDRAEEMYSRALRGYEDALGPDHTSTLSTVNNLGVLYRAQGKLDRAEEMYSRALRGYEDALGPDHTSTLDTVNNLGLLYCDQGKLDRAEEMYSRALRGYENALGPDHTSTLNTVHNLGVLYSAQGKLDRAEEMYSRALRGREKALGTDHMSTLNTVHNLGLLYRAQGKLDRAEEMYSRALRGKENALGPDHTSTLNTVNNLGVFYSDQGKLDRAEEMYSRALRGYEDALSLDHTSTLGTVNNIGNLYSDQGKLDRAEEMYSRALRGYENALGPDHTSTLDTVNNLGLLYSDQGKLDRAEEMCSQALRGYEKALGPDHTSTLDTVRNLGLLYRAQGKLDRAEKMYLRALRGYEDALGPDHMSTLNTVNNLGLLYCDQGKLDRAEEMYSRALRGKEKALGPDHTSTLMAVNNLGVLYRAQRKLDRAEEMYSRALRGYEDALGPDDTSTLMAVNNLGLLYCDQGKLDRAVEMVSRALNILVA